MQARSQLFRAHLDEFSRGVVLFCNVTCVEGLMLILGSHFLLITTHCSFLTHHFPLLQYSHHTYHCSPRNAHYSLLTLHSSILSNRPNSSLLLLTLKFSLLTPHCFTPLSSHCPPVIKHSTLLNPNSPLSHRTCFSHFSLLHSSLFSLLRAYGIF